MAARFLHCSLPVLWAIKRRRTDRRRTEPPQSPFPPSQDEEDCILGLLMLSRAPLVLHGGAPKQQPVLLPRSSPPATTRKGELYPISFPGLTPFLPPPPPEQHPSAPAPKKQDQKLLPPPPPEQERSLLSSPALKQQRQKEPLPPPTPSTDDLLRYKCSECGKAFSSFQALGGHKSSHYRKRPSPSPLPEKQRRVKARRALAMPSTSPTECSPKKGHRIDLKINRPLMEID